MERITHQLVQNSPEWHAFRAEHYGASEAAACLGISPYMPRDELIAEKVVGISKEVSPALQDVFARGHETEIGGRKLAESIIADDLFPVTMSYSKLSASCDGLTMDSETAFEHKQWSKSLAESISNGDLPDHHMPQCQQVLYVTGANRLLFMTSDGTDSHCAWMWVYPDFDYQQRLVNAWEMLAADCAAYVPQEVVREAVAAPQVQLPAVSVQVSGSIAIIDNLNVFGQALTDYVARINNKPETDDDFATLDAQVKILKGAEEALTAAENNALGQASDIDALRRSVALYKDVARQARLTAEKIVKAEKENRKTSIIKSGIESFREFIAQIEASRFTMAMRMPDQNVDFITPTKGLKTIASIQNAVNTTLANAKVAASSQADKIAANLKTIAAAGNSPLFVDYRMLALKDTDDLAAVIDQRINAAKAQEEKRAEEMRAKIRAEEEAKATAKANAEAKAEREAAEKLGQQLRDQVAKELADQKAANGQATVSNNGASSTQAKTPFAEPAEAVAQSPAPVAVATEHGAESVTVVRDEVIASLYGLTAHQLGMVAHYIDRLISVKESA